MGSERFRLFAHPKFGKLRTLWECRRTGRRVRIVSRAEDQWVSALSAVAAWVGTINTKKDKVLVPVWRMENVNTRKLTTLRDDILGRNFRQVLPGKTVAHKLTQFDDLCTSFAADGAVAATRGVLVEDLCRTYEDLHLGYEGGDIRDEISLW